MQSRVSYPAPCVGGSGRRAVILRGALACAVHVSSSARSSLVFASPGTYIFSSPIHLDSGILG